MLTKKEFFEKHLKNADEKFAYMLLSRMQSDCEYFINACNGHKSAVKFLWASEGIDAHIQYMKYIWETLPEKPEWLPMAKIEAYEILMKGQIT